jgi:hypothetical protein
MKWLKLIVFAVGTYYILRFLVRLYNARKKMHSSASSELKNQNTVHPSNKKSMINPEAGEYTDYEEIKD